MFKGRHLLIATKHEKDKVIAPVFEKELGVKCFVCPGIDTDEFGTFTGEVERKDAPATTARRKCLMAIKLTNCDLAIASEGSFGPHPSIYFVPADEELLLFVDKKNDLEIIVRELSTETNFNGLEIKTEKELQEFASHSNFPSHGLILRKSKEDFSGIVKGITNPEELGRIFQSLISRHGMAYVETDMRAMHNPTRMKVIEKAACKLVDKIKSLCPKCRAPGFGIIGAKQGLPCKICNLPTGGTLSYIYSCQKCSFTNEEKYPNSKQTEDPIYCDVCNP